MPDHELINPDGSAVHAPPIPTLPPPEVEGLVIREGTMHDLPFIDEQQKAKINHNRLGFLKTDALIGKIKQKRVLIAEAPTHAPRPSPSPHPPPPPPALQPPEVTSVGSASATCSPRTNTSSAATSGSSRRCASSPSTAGHSWRPTS